MKIKLAIFLVVFSQTCFAQNGAALETQKSLDPSVVFKNRYTLGFQVRDYSNEKNEIKYPDVKYGLVILKISTHSNAFKADFKSGWVIISIDGIPLEKNGIEIFRDRIQDHAKPNLITLKVFNGEKFIEVALSRQSFPEININNDLGNFIVVP